MPACVVYFDQYTQVHNKPAMIPARKISVLVLILPEELQLLRLARKAKLYGMETLDKANMCVYTIIQKLEYV